MGARIHTETGDFHNYNVLLMIAWLQVLCNVKISVVCALWGLISARGRSSNGRGQDNARAKPAMHTKLVSSATHLPKTAIGL